MRNAECGLIAVPKVVLPIGHEEVPPIREVPVAAVDAITTLHINHLSDNCTRLHRASGLLSFKCKMVLT